MKLTKDDLEEIEYFLWDYLQFFKKRKNHTKKTCDICKSARRILKKLK